MGKPNALTIIQESLEDMSDKKKEWPCVAMLSGPKEVIEIMVLLASKNSGCKMDWGYVGGRAIVCSPGDRKKCRRELFMALPQSDLSTSDLI